MQEDATALQLQPEATASAAADLGLRIGTAPHSPTALWVKRLLDVTICTMVGVAGTPLLAFIALAVKLTSPGPVLFRQVRLGKDGVPFTFYKFRSMRHGNDDSSHRDFSRNFIRGRLDDPNASSFKMIGDPRITGVGRFLRRTSLDELPQLWNVLKGEMSLVGPRPPISYEIQHYEDWHLDRLRVKPGLTGLWQVSGRSQVPFDEMVLLDLHYITHWSLALDLKILGKTLPVVVRGDGAF